MNQLPVFSLIAVLAALLAAPVAWAEKADRSRPMNIEADTLRHDDLRQTSVFTGKVVATKGSIVIRGTRLEVRQDPEGFQYGVVTAEPGKLAFWRQKREGVDEYIEGEGERIEYDGKLDRVKFISRAEMRRLRGATLADEMNGSVITYDNATDSFNVDGAPATGVAQQGGGRVRAVLAPRPSASAPAPPPATPGAAPLRPSVTLGGERR
ncbi:MAG TPA: lipopolysaccharide transport periplasmic protein LptA [Ramlibacter sp.]|nr:lipopolysaccharide transport periplasmic protein LptA [Ramlibacter sp.]